jgi:hypothetical protein
MSVLGIDIAKRVFHAVGMDKRGESVLPTSPRESRFSIAYSHPYMNPMTWR